jgi:hypothetical protein
MKLVNKQGSYQDMPAVVLMHTGKARDTPTPKQKFFFAKMLEQP